MQYVRKCEGKRRKISRMKRIFHEHTSLNCNWQPWNLKSLICMHYLVRLSRVFFWPEYWLFGNSISMDWRWFNSNQTSHAKPQDSDQPAHSHWFISVLSSYVDCWLKDESYLTYGSEFASGWSMFIPSLNYFAVFRSYVSQACGRDYKFVQWGLICHRIPAILFYSIRQYARTNVWQKLIL